MRAGVDKLGLFTADFKVVDAGKLNRVLPTQIGVQDAPMPILVPSDTNPIYGSKAYMNVNQGTEQSVNVTLEPMGKGLPTILKVTFNPSKYALGGAELLSSPDILGDVVNDVQERINDAGIITDLMGAKLTRVDLTKQAEMPSLARDYIGKCYDFLNAKYGRGVVRKKSNEDYYLLRAGKSWQLCAYDKNAEQTKEAPIPSNLLRNELRLFKAKNIKAQIGANSVHEFLNCDWNNAYNSFLEKRVFNRWQDGEQLTLNFQDIDCLIDGYLTRGEKIDVMGIVTDYGLLGIVDTYGSIDAFMSRFAGHLTRTTYWRYQTKLEMRYAKLKTRTRDMVAELRSAFLQAI
jgi:hypothetical protein